MKAKKLYFALIVFSVIAFLCNLIFFGYSFEEKAFDFDLRFDNFIAVPCDLFRAIASFCLIVSIAFIPKTKALFCASCALTAVAEIYSYVTFLVIYYKPTFFSYDFYVLLYNTIAVVILAITAVISVLKKTNFASLNTLSWISLFFHIIVCIIPTIFFSSFINITLELYYIFLYLTFALVGKYIIQCNVGH